MASLRQGFEPTRQDRPYHPRFLRYRPSLLFGPLFYWSTVPVHWAQEALRRAFERWGRPKTLRVDNGNPWGTASGLPSALSLWAAGLAIDMYWNDTYRPQQNGVVESTQGTTQRWVEPSQCANFAQLCRRVAQEDRIQREVYPAIDGQSRRAAYRSC